jgi:hypothetical protein
MEHSDHDEDLIINNDEEGLIEVVPPERSDPFVARVSSRSQMTHRTVIVPSLVQIDPKVLRAMQAKIEELQQDSNNTKWKMGNMEHDLKSEIRLLKRKSGTSEDPAVHQSCRSLQLQKQWRRSFWCLPCPHPVSMGT